jgi:hypothetical protein
MPTTSKTIPIATLALAVLAGCATRPTVDDGRALDRALVARMQAFGEAAVALRPAIVRSAAAANRAALSGVDHVAAGVFERADQWAFDAMRRLGKDPRAGPRLHEKLVAQGAADNAFLLDAHRLAAMRKLVADPH